MRLAVNRVDLGALGTVIGRGIKTALSFVSGLLDPFLFYDIKFIKDVDWKELGRTISRGIEAALDFLIDLLENINWAAIGQAIGDLLSGIDWDGHIGPCRTANGRQICGETFSRIRCCAQHISIFPILILAR